MTATPQFDTLTELEVAAYHYATKQTGRDAIGSNQWCISARATRAADEAVPNSQVDGPGTLTRARWTLVYWQEYTAGLRELYRWRADAYSQRHVHHCEKMIVYWTNEILKR